jgi:hypothetical protein
VGSKTWHHPPETVFLFLFVVLSFLFNTALSCEIVIYSLSIV